MSITVSREQTLEKNIRALFNAIGTPTNCTACGRPIWFVTTKNGKQMPVTEDAVSHFVNCPAADRFRKRA